VKLLHEAYDGYVYDIETELGVFHAGVGNLIVKNTDSVFAIFPNEELRVDPHTGAMEHVKLRGKAALQASINCAIEGSKRFREGHLKKPHDLEYEKTFYPFIILSKKRYIGNLYEHDPNKFKQKSMGVVLKRRDNANIVKHIYGGIIDIILNECDVQKSLAFLNDNLGRLVDGKVDMDMLVITKTLKGSYKNPLQIAHKVLADRMRERDPGSAPQTNDRVPYVYIRPPTSSSTTGTGSPAASASAAASVPASTRTSAVSVARFTLASSTPGTRRSAFSTRKAQVAQVMPAMPSSTWRSGTW
jgi:DNA polymerase elongation subunit (family B)